MSEHCNDPPERWKAVRGYEGLYDVSTWGRVRSHNQILNRKNGTVKWKGRILKPQRGSKGHWGVNLHRDGRSKTHFIHRLVAEAFLENEEDYPLVRHLDDVKENNRLENLEWGTYSDNAYDAIRNGRDLNQQAHKTHCPQNHPYSGDNLYVDPKGRRHCRKCARLYQQGAGRDNAKARRLKGLPEGDPRHGSVNGYSNYACRCERCYEAGRRASKNRNEGNK